MEQTNYKYFVSFSFSAEGLTAPAFGNGIYETENQIKSWNDIQELQNKIMIQNEEMTGVAVINFIQLD